MKREVAAYLIVGALVAIGVLFLYSVSVEFTGQVVLEQQTQTEFDFGNYTNVVYDENLSAIILDVNQTSGTYTSKIFDSGNDSVWNNLTWVGSEALVFEVKACSSSDCANESFASADLNNLNLTAQYFQYQVLFTEDPNLTVSLESVSIDYSVPEPEPEPAPENVTVSVSEPIGEKDSVSGIPITFTTTGTNLTCLYNVEDSNQVIVIENTTLTDCADSTFDVNADGSYVFTIYVSNSLESISNVSGFSVVTPVEEEETTTEETQEVEIEQPIIQQPTQPQGTTKLEGGDIQALSLSAGNSESISWSLTNTGTNPVSSCKVKPLGEFVSWFSFSEDSANLNSAEGKEFVFDVIVPEGSEEGSYLLSVSIECFETAVAKDFTVDVTPSESVVEVGATEGTPVGGFAIFGEDGIGTGGVVVLLIVVLALVAVLFVTRRLRKSGKTLRDVFNDFNFKFGRQ